MGMLVDQRCNFNDMLLWHDARYVSTGFMNREGELELTNVLQDHCPATFT